MITCVSAKAAAPVPPLLTVIVQLNDAFWTTLPLALLDLVTVRSAIWRLTVCVAVLEVTPLTPAEAIFVTNPAVTSAAVTV
jgi:hypothetical protein